ncbi:MAG: ABC transporter ATP-binding protein [Candidatus Omnitrophica bacterium]|nr:ABC transporter ATP-binding protein [Candidatus Omnitrophota bacterium]
MSAISIRKLVKVYGALRAVDGIDLEVAEGDFVGFLGPNGAGKTTTIHSITGLCNFQGGSMRVFGLDVVSDYRKTRPLIGLCPQEFNFDPFLSIHGLLVYQAGYFGIPKSVAAKKADELLGYFRLSEKRNVDFRKLSGGMKKRLLLCRALVHDPKILILDEPTAGADVELKYQIWNFLEDLNKKGKTIFLTTHYMEEAERLSRKIVIIHKGRILHHGDKEALVRDQSLEKKYLELTREKADD